MTSNNVKSTTDYKMFKTLIDNRQTSRSHINKLKDAISNNPEIMKVQPILVNEKYEIIDGQHRFQAVSELGLPVHYTQVKGLNIATAREMNVIQRRWTLHDYAYSYAKAGNVHYKAFNKYMRDNPGLPISIIMRVLSGRDSKSLNYDFRNGTFVIGRDQGEAEWLLGELNHIKEVTGGEIPISTSFVSALTKALDNEDFDYQEFITRLSSKPEMFRRTPLVRDALRMIEDICNYKKSVNTIRLY